MDTKSMTRKEFVTLTFTLIGSAAAACSSSSSSNDGGTGGSFGTGGTTGTGGVHGTGGANGTGGASGATGTGGASGSPGTAGTSGNACTSPLPETQVADSTGHTHDVMIPASDLDATTAQMITTTDPVSGTASPHTHIVTLSTANLLTLKGGGSVIAPSSITMSHAHMFMVSCT